MGILRRFSLALAALAALSAVAPHAQAAVTNTERSAETYLLGLVNADRKAAHIGTLKEHSYIRTQTESHSTDMMRRRTMDHSGFSTRVKNIRAHDSGMRNSGMCENVAAASKYSDVASAMRAIDAAWKRSTEHYKCMYDKEGWSSQSASVGVRYDGKTFWATFITGRDTNP